MLTKSYWKETKTSSNVVTGRIKSTLATTVNLHSETSHGCLAVTGLQEENRENEDLSKQLERILQSCALHKAKYVDEDFPASNSSLICSEKKQGHKEHSGQFKKSLQSVISWQRPENIRVRGADASEKWTLVNDPRPSDIYQGELGNCWFVAALALIAERKELLEKTLFTTEINPAGVYIIKLFKDGNWTNVIVDDLLPCDSFHRLVFSSCRRKQLWVPLIEKAMSKLHGSYEVLQSGSIWDGLNYLTGYVSERVFLKSENDLDFLWGRLLSFHSCGFLMGATITTSKDLDEYFEKKGLVANHVYSVLQVVCNGGNRLIQLRNPWGRFSWNGDWSDTSSLWKESLRQDLSPNQNHEGIFWISFHHFTKYYTCLDVCKVRQGWKMYSMNGILSSYADQDCQPCFELVCSSPACEVDISLYQSSKRNSREMISLTDIGFVVFEIDEESRMLQFTKTVELVKSSRRRCVTANLMLTKGRYCIIPFSFGHWRHIDNDTFYPFTLTMHASRELSCSTVRTSNLPYILADALLVCAEKYGKRKQFVVKEKYGDVSILSVDLGIGCYTVLENRSMYHVQLKMESRNNENYITTRGSLLINDCIPPLHRQVMQVFSARDAKKPSRISNSYELHISDKSNSVQQDKLLKMISTHIPKLTNRISGLHTARPIIF